MVLKSLIPTMSSISTLRKKQIPPGIYSLTLEFIFKKKDIDLLILIDNYDSVMKVLLGKDYDEFKEAYSCLKSFFIETNCYGGLGKIFATGICPLYLSNGRPFHNYTFISQNVRFNSMMGLTHDEVRNLIEKHAEGMNWSIYNMLLESSGGYQFNGDSKERVFNTEEVMYCLKEYEKEGIVSSKLFGAYLKSKYEELVEIINQYDYSQEELIKELLFKDGFRVTSNYIYTFYHKFTKEDVLILLFCFGYLTISERADEKIVFEIPNKLKRECIMSLL